MMKSAVCDILGIEKPIFQGGMAWIADARLAAAVSNAGGLGLISSINDGTEAVRAEIRKAKALTEKPFGVNIMLAAPNAAEVADLVVDIEQLRGEWCYMVQPKLRERAGFNQATLKREMTPEQDSLLQQLLQPREYGVEIKSGYTAQPIGAVRSMTSDEESPVEYPPLKRYREWRIFNGRLILSETSRDTLGNTTVTNSDTATFVLLRRDSLVLRIGDEERGYYRRLASELSD